jgi:polyisoprenoid-binding protein YceI
MKSHLLHIIHIAAGKVRLTSLLLALAFCIASIPAHAQGGVWQVDAEHSIARLSLGSAPRAAEVGIARVSGNVAFDANDPADPVVNLNILPDKNSGADYSQISFKSKRSEMTSDGKLAVVGDLSLTRVERSVTLDANEGYYGAQYGEPVVNTDTREVTLVLPGTSLPATENGAMQLSAATNISRERFPQLLTALAPGNWQTAVVEDENCTMQSGLPGEDYSGAACTGTTVASKTNVVASGNPGIGEGYYGFEPAVVPDGSQASIAFDLKLTQVASGASVTSGAAEIAGN